MNNTLPRFATISQFPSHGRYSPTNGGDFSKKSDFFPVLLVNVCEASTVPAMLKPTSTIPARNLGDEVWEIQHIATFLQIRSSAANRYAAHPDFPVAFLGNRHCRRWYADEIKDFFRKTRTRADQSPRHVTQRSVAVVRKSQRKAS